jgi:transcriptional regulator with XRE-family HTH domain
MATKTAFARILDSQGRTQAWVAAQLHVSRGTVSRWYTGKRPIPEHHLSTLAKLLDVTEEELQPP